MLSQAMHDYVALKRSLGFKFLDQSRMLADFVVFAEARGDLFVVAETAIQWAAGAPSPGRRIGRLRVVRRFALTLQAGDDHHQTPHANALGRAVKQRPAPYIFSEDEICLLMEAARCLPPTGTIRSRTYATLIGLLAATGMRISEALALRLSDITDDGLIVRESKFRKSRLLPLHPTARAALDAYVALRGISRADDPVFVVNSGKTPDRSTASRVFLALERAIGLRGPPGQRGSHLHDLRHTFAVRSLEQCQPDKRAVSRHIAALSTYMGHACIGDTYWYLQATPVLMTQIAEAGAQLMREART